MPQRDMSGAWPRVNSLSARPHSYWHPDNMQALQHYMALAVVSLQQGQRTRAIDSWETALRRFPTLPVPRRQRLIRFIVAAWHDEARDALRQAAPDYRGAVVCLQSAWRALTQDAPSGRGVDAAHAAIRQETARLLGFLSHLDGKYTEALSFYAELDGEPEFGARPTGERVGDASEQLTYARTLAQLQAAELFGVSARETAIDELHVAGAARKPSSSTVHEPARRRLAAFARLFASGAMAAVAEAQALFPVPETPKLPLQWALEGALLAALNDDWPRCVAYYRAAFAHGRPPLADVHRHVLLVATQYDDSSQGEAWHDDVLLTWTPPATGNEHLFPDRIAYGAWREAVLAGRQRSWLARARDAVVVGEYEKLRQYLNAAISALPRKRLSRHLKLWLACTDADRMWPLRGRWDARDVALLRLSVLAAERWQTTAHVVQRLSTLLQQFPNDAWGLARWRHWMTALGERALAEGHHRQALLQFASLLMNLPDDVTGWNGCGRAHAAAGDERRAADCFAEARRFARKSPARIGVRMEDRSAAAQTFNDAANDVLLSMLEDVPVARVAVRPCPLSPRALREQLWQSLRTQDAYVRNFVERWAMTPGTDRTRG